MVPCSHRLVLDDTESLIPPAASHRHHVFTSDLRPDYRHKYGVLPVYTMHQSETVRELAVCMPSCRRRVPCAGQSTWLRRSRSIPLLAGLLLCSFTSSRLQRAVLTFPQCILDFGSCHCMFLL